MHKWRISQKFSDFISEFLSEGIATKKIVWQYLRIYPHIAGTFRFREQLFDICPYLPRFRFIRLVFTLFSNSKHSHLPLPLLTPMYPHLPSACDIIYQSQFSVPSGLGNLIKYVHNLHYTCHVSLIKLSAFINMWRQKFSCPQIMVFFERIETFALTWNRHA